MSQSITTEAESDSDASRTPWLEKAHQIDDSQFFRGPHGQQTIVTARDLKRSIPDEELPDLVEIDRYWVTFPYAFASIARSRKDNEYRYYVVEPSMSETEAGVLNFLTAQIQTSIRHSDIDSISPDDGGKRELIRDEYVTLVDNYGLNDGTIISRERPKMFPGDAESDDTGGSEGGGVGGVLRKTNVLSAVVEAVEEYLPAGDEQDDDAAVGTGQQSWAAEYGADTRCEYVLPGETPAGHPGSAAPEGDQGVAGKLLDETRLTDYQAIKLLYYLERDFAGFQRIDPVKHDINIEEISTPGYGQPVYVYHSEFERVPTNIVHDEDELDSFISQIAQVAGKEINHRNPQVDAILSDGSRAQLTYKTEVAEGGSNYTIRQFREVPFTPIDLLCWGTFSLEQLAYFWLCVEEGRSLLLAGGTATGKTTALNALSLFISTNDKVISIEDTRELEIPHRNWIAETTREAVGENQQDSIDEYELLEAALRQRPDYLLMGEVRGEEGRDLFQVMSSGHTSFSTFHASSVGEVLKRFTTDPINVPKPVFTTLDIVCTISTQQIDGAKARRVNTVSEIGTYQTDSDQVSVKDIFSWTARGDRHLKEASSGVIGGIQEEKGWSRQELREELLKREALLAYLLQNDIRSYRAVVVAVQTFINDPETALSLMANGVLSDALTQLEEIDSIEIDTDDSVEQTVNRPSPSDAVDTAAKQTLAAAKSELFPAYEMSTGETLDADLELDIELDIPGGGYSTGRNGVRGNDYTGDTAITLTSLGLSETTTAYLRRSSGAKPMVEHREPDFSAEEESEVVSLPGEDPDTSPAENGSDETGTDASGASAAPDSGSSQQVSTPTSVHGAGGDETESAADSDSVLGELFGAPGDAPPTTAAQNEDSTAETALGQRSDDDTAGGTDDSETAGDGVQALGELFSGGDESRQMRREVSDLEGYAVAAGNDEDVNADD